MKNKKLKLFSNLNIILAAVSILLSVLFFVLLQTGVIELTKEGDELGEGIAAVFAVLFFVFFVMGQTVLCIYMVTESVIARSIEKGTLRSQRVFTVGGIIKIIFAAASVFMAVLFFSLEVSFTGIIAIFFALVLLFSGIFGINIGKIKRN